MSHVITQRFQPFENNLFISGSIVDVMNFKNITKEGTPVPFRVNLNKYSNLSERIFGFSNLELNWDSYNAEVISNTAIEVAKETLDFLNMKGLLRNEVEIYVFPMRDGGIQFEFDGEHICAELEVSPNGDSTFILFDDDGNIIEKEQLFELSELSTRLEDAQYA